MHVAALLVAQPCGLRDYGTGAWEGGDPECEHSVGGQVQDTKAPGAITTGQRPGVDASACRKCGARRVDQQLGLEPTPELYVARMVEVFREVRRVLRSDGTCWLNLGDSYASNGSGDTRSGFNSRYFGTDIVPGKQAATAGQLPASRVRNVSGLKPKDLVGAPWRVAFALQADGWYLRGDIIWAKPNPMPESVTDRPTKAHEYVFLLTKSPRYFFDQEAVREKYESGVMRDGFRGENDGPSAYVGQSWGQPNSEKNRAKGPDGRRKTSVLGGDGSIQHRDGERWPNGGRNVRSVWETPENLVRLRGDLSEADRSFVLAELTKRGL